MRLSKSYRKKATRLSNKMENETQHQKQEKLFEQHVLEVAGVTFIILLLLFGISYKFYFSTIPEFMTKTGIYIIYLLLAVVANATAMYHLKSYRNAVTCMTGMMIGMTLGMITGFTFGYVVGATNGMFMGSVYGMIIGIGVGAWSGKCCGIMGIMEGMMAGLMGGTMGAMLSVMLLADHILIFTPIFIAACLSILVGLGYLVYQEHSSSDEKIIKPYPLQHFFSACLIISAITVWIMIYGPKSGIVS